MADKKIDQGAGPSAPVEPIRGAEDAPQKPQDVPQAAPVTIPLLTAQDIECRVQSVSRSKGSGRVGAVLLLYKDARVDMRILDQVFGPNNWRRTHEVINGNLFCNIDIWDAQKHDWVRKQDVGVESNTEKEKGQASDAFKRAGFNVGIGRELYTAPFIYVELAENEFYVEPASACVLHRRREYSKLHGRHEGRRLDDPSEHGQRRDRHRERLY